MFWGTFFETLEGMKEIQTGAQKGYDISMFRQYAPDTKSFIEDKKIPNSVSQSTARLYSYITHRTPPQVTVCVGKIRHTGKSSYAKEVDFMKSIVPKEEWKNIKITMISPSWYHFRYGAGKAYPKEVYANDEEYFADVAKAYQVELKLLHEGEHIANFSNSQADLYCSRDQERTD